MEIAARPVDEILGGLALRLGWNNDILHLDLGITLTEPIVLIEGRAAPQEGMRDGFILPGGLRKLVFHPEDIAHLLDLPFAHKKCLTYSAVASMV